MDFIIIIFLGEDSDVRILVKGEEINVHHLVLTARCKEISNEVFCANGRKYHERWSHLQKPVVEAFVSYLYTGIIDVELDSSQAIGKYV